MLSLDRVSVRYPGSERPSLLDVTLDVPDGLVTGIAGASESGKTTLCLAIAGLVPRVARATMTGVLTIDGEDVGDRPMHDLAGRVGILTGPADTLLSLVADTVFEEVAFGPANLGVPRDEVIARVESAIASVGLDGLEERDPRRLSSGQAQLVSIAGTLAMGSSDLVLDEPTAHLDPVATDRLLAVVRGLARAGTAVLIASQDTRLLAATCDRAAVLDQGRLGPVGPVADVLGRPQVAVAGLEPLTAGSADR